MKRSKKTWTILIIIPDDYKYDLIDDNKSKPFILCNIRGRGKYFCLPLFTLGTKLVLKNLRFLGTTLFYYTSSTITRCLVWLHKHRSYRIFAINSVALGWKSFQHYKNSIRIQLNRPTKLCTIHVNHFISHTLLWQVDEIWYFGHMGVGQMQAKPPQIQVFTNSTNWFLQITL